MRTLPLIFLLLVSCRDERPPTPTQEESARLNDADTMLNEFDRAEPAKR